MEIFILQRKKNWKIMDDRSHLTLKIRPIPTWMVTINSPVNHTMWPQIASISYSISELQDNGYSTMNRTQTILLVKKIKFSNIRWILVQVAVPYHLQTCLKAKWILISAIFITFVIFFLKLKTDFSVSK